jgi:phospholipid/cholesterol/gamma-HCH transport system ATP-binding protein
MLFKFFVLTAFAGYLVLLTVIVVHRLRHRSSRRLAISERPEPDPGRREVLIELVGVEKGFDTPVLTNIDLKIYRGETLGVLGRSGTGKSVLLKLIVGLLKPDRGRVLFKGKNITEMDETELLEVRKAVSYVFQAGAIFDFLDAAENIAFPLRERGCTDERQIGERVEYLLNAVELEGWGDARVGELSVGAKKQVAIARAIASNPEAILYDEPTTGVDPIIGKSLSRLIRKLNLQEHLTSIVVTHDLKCLEIVADRIVLLKDGGILFEGDRDAFRSSADPFVQAFIAGRHVPRLE